LEQIKRGGPCWKGGLKTEIRADWPSPKGIEVREPLQSQESIGEREGQLFEEGGKPWEGRARVLGAGRKKNQKGVVRGAVETSAISKKGGKREDTFGGMT